MEGDSGESLVIQGYAPNIRSVGTIPSGLAESLTAFTAIYSIASLLADGSSLLRILYDCYSGP
jgi:hypothetical protein